VVRRLAPDDDEPVMAATSPSRADAVVARNLANYDSEWSAREYSRTVGLRPIEAALIDRYFPVPPAAVLDLGCGAGRTSVALKERGYRVVAIDLAASLLSIARARHPGIDFRLMDARRLELPDASIDAALFSYNGLDVIYPVAERVRSLQETARVLRPGGAFVLSSHNLIGALCCAGPWYLRGHLASARFLLRQIGNLRAPEWYLRYRDGGGDQWLYSAPPSRTIRQLESAGFAVEAVCGDAVGEEASRRQVTTRYQHVHFVARKV
jgi:ubiquinone/menaquinone biosynthesis C-methylase UbiE